MKQIAKKQQQQKKKKKKKIKEKKTNKKKTTNKQKTTTKRQQQKNTTKYTEESTWKSFFRGKKTGSLKCPILSILANVKLTGIKQKPFQEVPQSLITAFCWLREKE